MLEVHVIPFCVHIVPAGLPDGLFRFSRAVVHSLPLLPLYYTRNAHKMQGAGQFLCPSLTPPRAPWRGPFPPWQQRGPPGQKPAPNQTARVSRQVSIAGRSRIHPRKAKLREPPAAWRANCRAHGCGAARTHLGNIAGRSRIYPRNVKLRELPAPWRKKTAALLGDCFFSVGEHLSSRAVTSQVFSARTSLTSVFGMGTGGPSS